VLRRRSTARRLKRAKPESEEEKAAARGYRVKLRVVT